MRSRLAIDRRAKRKDHLGRLFGRDPVGQLGDAQILGANGMQLRERAAATRDFDCSFAVTDDSYDQFAGWAGLHAARSAGFSPSDASLIASDLGLGIMNSADWDQADLILDQDQALIGVGKCL
jgi:hypothetical protein